MSIIYPPRLRLAQTQTPLVPLHRYCQRHSLPLIWVKRDDLTGSVTGGNKIRKLDYLLADAVEKKADVIITYGGVQSNHCRTTALLGAQLGLQVHLVLRGEPEAADGNLLLDQLSGARISFHRSEDFEEQQQAIEDELLEYYAAQGVKAYTIPIGASNGLGVWGYVSACEELASDFVRHDIQPKHIVCASGSGGTHAGLIAGEALYDLGSEVWGINVCGDEAWFVNKIRSDLHSWAQQEWTQQEICEPVKAIDVDALAINVIDGHVGPGYALADDEVLETIAEVARTEGVVFDPIYTGKAFHGLVKEIANGRFNKNPGDFVFIHTGGIFGIYPFRGRFENLTIGLR